MDRFSATCDQGCKVGLFSTNFKNLASTLVGYSLVKFVGPIGSFLAFFTLKKFPLKENIAIPFFQQIISKNL